MEKPDEEERNLNLWEALTKSRKHLTKKKETSDQLADDNGIDTVLKKKQKVYYLESIISELGSMKKCTSYQSKAT